MNATTIVLVVEGVLLAVALVFIVALLRSHADILRRLEEIDETAGSAAGWPGLAGPGQEQTQPSPQAAGQVGDIAGETLVGDAIKVALGPGSPRTLLAFLSSTCNACGPLWAGLEDPQVVSGGARLVTVTKGPERERLARLIELAPAAADVVMSSAAWTRFEIPATPHFVLVEDGQILGRGSANSWEQISGLLSDAGADSEIYRARSTSDRAARAEQTLAAAGIDAGHPSLYPSQDPSADAEAGAR